MQWMTKWTTPYSNMTVGQAEKTSGFILDTLNEISVVKLLADANKDMEAMLKGTKDEVHKKIVQYLRGFGNPTETDQCHSFGFCHHNANS